LAICRDTAFSEVRRKRESHGGADDGFSGSGAQVCCVNFLFPFADQPRALAHVLRRAFPCVREMLPMESGQYVAFEWIGRDNYLGEIVRGNGKRTRGANVTSADAAVMFLRTDGKRQIVLIEWKYTESYGGNCLTIAKSGTDRTKIYRHLFQRDDCPVDKSLLPDFDALFYEPFYQFFRQQCLAREMERAREMDADIVSVLHLAPGPNIGFRRVTSPGLQSLGKTATEVWTRLAGSSGRFLSRTVEEVFGGLSQERIPEMGPWLEYIEARYSWDR
jgi:hypothetical protein